MITFEINSIDLLIKTIKFYYILDLKPFVYGINDDNVINVCCTNNETSIHFLVKNVEQGDINKLNDVIEKISRIGDFFLQSETFCFEKSFENINGLIEGGVTRYFEICNLNILVIFTYNRS